MLAVINPKLGKFNVTDKGTQVVAARFDYRTSWPTLVLLGLSGLGLMVAFPFRLLMYGQYGADPGELDAILINSVWALANFVTLIAAACVAYEQPQHRAAPRVRREYPCRMVSQERVAVCRSRDLSENGVRLALSRPMDTHDRSKISIQSDFGVEAEVDAELVWSRQGKLGEFEAAFRFVDVSPEVHQKLVQLMFSADRTWEDQTYPEDRLWISLWRLVTAFWRVSALRPGQS
jgi:cellulose synthase (UDP-forming)